MAHGEASRFRTAVRLALARFGGRSCFKGAAGFTLVEVQVAIVLFVFGMIAVLGYASVNRKLIGSVESERALDGYADLAAERVIVTMTGEPGTTGLPACDVRLQSIDTSGLYPVVEISAQRVTP
jgi:hypothetical protein